MEQKEHHLKNGLKLIIREARPQDAADLISYVNKTGSDSNFLSYGPGEFEITEEEEKKILQRFFDTENHLYIIGLIDGKIVASLSFSARRRPRIRHKGEFGMAVDKEYWGLGIGSLVIDELIHWAKETGIITKINLRVRPDNKRAVQLYERKGFVHEGRISRDMVIDGVYYDSCCMGLEL